MFHVNFVNNIVPSQKQKQIPQRKDRSGSKPPEDDAETVCHRSSHVASIHDVITCCKPLYQCMSFVIGAQHAFSLSRQQNLKSLEPVVFHL